MSTAAAEASGCPFHSPTETGSVKIGTRVRPGMSTLRYISATSHSPASNGACPWWKSASCTRIVTLGYRSQNASMTGCVSSARAIP